MLNDSFVTNYEPEVIKYIIASSNNKSELLSEPFDIINFVVYYNGPI